MLNLALKGGLIPLTEDGQVFFNILPKLKEAEIYYSDNFKKIRLKDPAAFSGGVRLNEQSNLLEISFSHPEIAQTDLTQISSSLKEKKKYHRLKDDSFLSLDNQKLVAIADVFQQLDVSLKEIQNQVIHLPKYRATYLDNYLRESGLHHFARNQAFKQMVKNQLWLLQLLPLFTTGKMK